MIMSEYAVKLANDYCEKNGIMVVRGRILEDRYNEVRDFVVQSMEICRRKTRESEQGITRITKLDIGKAIPGLSQYESPLEEFMASGLLKNDLLKFFKPQLQIGKYRVDLACEKAFLVVECDGHAYHFTEKKQIERDQKRDKYLSRMGWRVLHFEGIAIRRNMDFCIEKVKDALKPFLSSEVFK